MEAPRTSKGGYRFGLFHFDPVEGKLFRKGLPVQLRGQPLQILLALLERPGEIVTREALSRSLWADGTYVEFDASLNAALKRLRFALRDNADNPVFVETIPKQGYRFIAAVKREPGSDLSLRAVSPQAQPRVRGDRSNTLRFTSAAKSRAWWLLAPAALLFSLMWLYGAVRLGGPTRLKVIAVLPFNNQGSGPELEFLRYAIANDLVTDLSHIRSVSVRPFASTSKYATQPSDPVKIGRELRVSHVLAGGYLREGPNLLITMELVDVARNEPVWRDEVTISGSDLLDLRSELADRTTGGLVPALNLLSAAAKEIPKPHDPRAFELYFHSVGFSRDPQPNVVAIKNLEESVSLDPGYAPAWDELCRRYYIDYEYGNGGDLARAKAVSACRRVGDLDPDGIMTMAPILAEQGDLVSAYDDAAALLGRRPSSSLSHYMMSYVLRYAGLLREAANECDAALAIDPGFWQFRSCATTYTLLGDFERARKYIALDANTGFARALRMEVELRTGDRDAALTDSAAASEAGGLLYTEVIQACLGPSPRTELEKAEAEVDRDPRLEDPEGLYRYAAVLSFCGQGEAAAAQLRKAIERNYCSYPVMDSDPLLNAIRQRPEFPQLREAGMRCRENFLAHRSQAARIQKAALCSRCGTPSVRF